MTLMLSHSVERQGHVCSGSARQHVVAVAVARGVREPPPPPSPSQPPPSPLFPAAHALRRQQQLSLQQVSLPFRRVPSVPFPPSHAVRPSVCLHAPCACVHARPPAPCRPLIVFYALPLYVASPPPVPFAWPHDAVVPPLVSSSDPPPVQPA